VKTLLRRAAATALGTMLGVSLLVAAKSAPSGPRLALTEPGVIGRRPAAPVPKTPATTAPPPPSTTTSSTPAPTSSSTVTTAAPAPPPPPPTATTTRPTAPSTTATTRAPARPAPPKAPPVTTATTVRPTTAPPPPAAAPPPPTTATATTGPPPPTTVTTAAASATTTVDSPVFTASYGREAYGYVQVRLTFQGHQIIDAVALQTPNSHAKSVQINTRATPILRQEVLAAQSAQIDTVSGATATSEAYAQCIQAILDQVWK